ncbi:uncharacterized protein PG998_009191 [Apiospora kogelbergensis]|uniref:Uncharacterized protein n=1 Tax=Apiospora kogelbergensis TaxID=1337665 RepID=A0AAW0R790_9PEZI
MFDRSNVDLPAQRFGLSAGAHGILTQARDFNNQHRPNPPPQPEPPTPHPGPGPNGRTVVSAD